MILYGKQDISNADIDAVVDVLQSDFLTQGPKVPAFEKAISDYCGASFAVAVNSATSALHIACLALNVGANDWVWTSPITFVASANCALYCGANIDFVDVEPTSGNMCPKALAAKLAWAAENACLPKVIIPVHLCGHSCDMKAISALAKQYDVKVIEDASHGIGGSFDGNKLGCCQYSDITVFSFHPVKIITSAEGGVATTNDSQLAQSMAMLRSHGITKTPQQMLRPNEGDWYYEQHQLGFNYRMTELQAALGLSQMTRLDEFISRRNQLAQHYATQLSGLAVNIVEPLSNSVSARHLQMIRLQTPSKRKAIFAALRNAEIQVHVHYFPVHLQPYYLNLGFAVGDYPQAERFYEQILTLPLHTQLTEQQVELVSLALAEHIV
ncbi:UDP-4-amino-4,6-dideoxy-N-acetyl-beta-L-altrosamine transaminase [Shewanella fidelis]|uniref:UDP-4-amino-4, 6-dideoxy-N-acetyl-beta-L-altrosamine transaminase n=1 Tax=Shewanella fidelis TaxID=173509 RepID=A0AAW8NMS7_9GAMM|nr:UDP-4-amino-4,6-dideoxy-N-acetyl-beta-L-altrosamine transaminase [Shewanella fidelis]MDR8524513.1 UDP-4-amino-4,6-dideoxy-N-acetyl-beta-L-altrosamine transaminase [Shewanella fidelis]MDW4811989.1 UDP-4-amino-4,6-dideoxy-N-acetyl-beta-L-altrosamine transaminase [Shewanella fidelis]MDW4817072.1 UDP-4-amino-4,6-dideoxy-N-acetyl-beta-L-altrosamine transaminase [Shewanella fidelis]MDW4821142.1 UDP-4-amino-4,6-dideoxy-N-acetyl-beta-L-altrosamine transaminase [Shewanella fidelis]MDW4822595.1 UDP-4